MTRCLVCQDARRPDIDHLLAAGRSARSLAAEFGLSNDSMKRHARSHVAARDRPVEPATTATPINELIGALRQRALDGVDASMAREYRLALAAQAEQNAERPAYNVLTDPEWVRLRTLLLDALRPFPEALQAVADALRGALA